MLSISSLLSAMGPMNDAGDAGGVHITVGSCFPSYPQCFGVNTPVVWRGAGGAPRALPAPPGAPLLSPPRAINSNDWVVGAASPFATPVTACSVSCLRVPTMTITAKRVSTCTQSNDVTVTASVTDEAGRPMPGVSVSGRFLDSYWLDKKLTRTTNTNGVARFNHKGPGCVGTITFLLDRATLTGKTFDRTQGVLKKSIIPPN